MPLIRQVRAYEGEEVQVRFTLNTGDEYKVSVTVPEELRTTRCPKCAATISVQGRPDHAADPHNLTS
jgi:hypothetical protein